jgi:hypothetical protein
LLDTLYSQIGAAIWLLACVFAFWKGDRTENWGAGILLIAWLASLFSQDDAAKASDLEPILFLIDAAVLACFAFMAWRSHRSWPIWATAFQGISIVVHIATLLNLKVDPYAQFTAMNIATYGVLGSMTTGTFIVWREREALRPMEPPKI